MSIYVIDISVVFINFLLLFTFNLGAYSANAMVWQNSKVEGMAMFLGYLLQTAQYWANTGVTEDGHCQGASSVVLLRPKLRRDRH